MRSNRISETQVATDFDKLCKENPKVLLDRNYITFFSDIQVTFVLPEVTTSLILLWDINILSFKLSIEARQIKESLCNDRGNIILYGGPYVEWRAGLVRVCH